MIVILVAGSIVHWLAYHGLLGGHRGGLLAILYIAVLVDSISCNLNSVLDTTRCSSHVAVCKVTRTSCGLALDLATAPSAHEVRPPDS